jgi:hypothetical protein
MVRQIKSDLGLKQGKAEDFKKTQSVGALVSAHLEDEHLATVFHAPVHNAAEGFTSYDSEADLRRAEAIQSLFTAHAIFR